MESSPPAEEDAGSSKKLVDIDKEFRSDEVYYFVHSVLTKINEKAKSDKENKYQVLRLMICLG